MLYRLKEPDFAHTDGRGTLVQLFCEGFCQVNVITSAKGALRGNHYHKQNTEAFYIISGSGQVELDDQDTTEAYQFSTGSFFEIGPNILHRFSFSEDTILVSMYSKGVELGNGQKDIFQHDYERD